MTLIKSLLKLPTNLTQERKIMMEIEQKRHKHTWAKEEDDIIFECVSSYPELREAMDEASKRIGIDFQRCRNRWYNVLSKKSAKIQESIAESKDKMITSLDSFLESVTLLKQRNRELEKKIKEQDNRINEQARIMRDMSNESKDLKESYTYILRVMEKARKMFVEEEQNKEKSYKVTESGNVVLDRKQG